MSLSIMLTSAALVQKVKNCLPVLCCMLLLTACSRGPSEAQILKAYQDEVSKTNTITRQFGTGIAAIQVNGLKKQHCTEFRNQGAYRCQVEIDSTLPMIGRTQAQTTLILKPLAHDAWLIDRTADAAERQ